MVYDKFVDGLAYTEADFYGPRYVTAIHNRHIPRAYFYAELQHQA